MLPWNAFKGIAFGLGIFIAFWSWVGFEAAPNYAEESKDPHRIIPIAVYVSCVFVGVLYTLASWASVSSYGPGNEAFDALATGSTTVFGGEIAVDYLNFNVVPANELIGTWLGQLMSVFIITGAFACAAALNNAGLRYTYALGREGLLPKALGRTHPKHKTPHVAVFTQAAIALAIILIFRFAGHTGLDVYYWIAVQGVIWIILVQALTSLSVWAYFRKLPASERSFWKTTVARLDRLPRPGPGALPLLQVPELAGRRRRALRQGAGPDRALGRVRDRHHLAGDHRRARAGGRPGLRPHPPLHQPRQVRAGGHGSSTRERSRRRSTEGAPPTAPPPSVAPRRARSAAAPRGAHPAAARRPAPPSRS